jgi:hypothetical protein
VTDHTQERLQRIEERVASLDDTVSILATVDDALAKQRIVEVFGDDPSMVIIYRGVEKKLSQTQIAGELRRRGLPRADQGDVSRACAFLLDKRFLKKKEPKGFAVRDGWEAFGLDKYLKHVLKTQKPPVEPLG